MSRRPYLTVTMPDGKVLVFHKPGVFLQQEEFQRHVMRRAVHFGGVPDAPLPIQKRKAA